MIEPGTAARTRVARYAAWSTGLVGLVVLAGGAVLDPAARNGLALAGGVTWLVQLVTFVALQTVPLGTPHFLGVWIGSTLIRFAAIGGGGFAIVGWESVDVVVTLFAMAGFFLALMFLELWVIVQGFGHG